MCPTCGRRGEWVIEKRVVALLLADGTIGAAVGGRVSPVVLRQESGLPALVYRRLDSSPEYTLAGRGGWRSVLLQVVCWASEYETARGLAEAVRLALDGFSENAQAGSIRFVSVSDGADEFVEGLEVFGCACMVTVEYDDGASVL